MKKKSFLFSLIGSALIIAFLLVVNLLTSWGHPWFIYPTFAVLWWPLSVYFAGTKQWKAYAVLASLMIIAFVILVNQITSPSFFWALFPIFAVVWWPLSMIICGAKRYKLYAFVASAWTIFFFVVLNLLTSPNTIWFVYPAYAVLWWPLSMLWANRRHIKLYSVVMSLLTIGFLALVNFITSSGFLWFLLTVFYIIWWPVVMFFGKKAGTIWFAVISALFFIAYHIGLYYYLTPEAHLWYLYLILPALWWPVTMILKDKMELLTFLIISAVVFLVYYGVMNILLSPDRLWSLYLVYMAVWAVIGIYFGRQKKPLGLAVWGTLITALLLGYINYTYSPNTIWAVYPIIILLWWPLSVYFFKVKKTKAA